MDKDLNADLLIGPDASYEYYLWLVSPALWAGLGFLVLPFFLQDLFAAFPNIAHFDEYYPGKVSFLVGILLLIAGFAISRLLYLSTLFVIKDAILYVKYGIITKVANTVPLRFVYDCDISSGPLEQLLGVNAMQVKVMGGNRRSYMVILRFVKDAEGARDFILQHSAVRNSSVVTAI